MGEFDLLAEVAVPFPMEILAPGHAVEDKTAPETAVDIGIQIALGAHRYPGNGSAAEVCSV